MVEVADVGQDGEDAAVIIVDLQQVVLVLDPDGDVLGSGLPHGVGQGLGDGAEAFQGAPSRPGREAALSRRRLHPFREG